MPGEGCLENSDCDSEVCAVNSQTCQKPACNDLTLNGEETDQDCGGSECPGCLVGGACNIDTDCFNTLICVDNACEDHPRNCTELLVLEPNTPSGVYTIDPDGFQGSGQPFDVYCDMTTLGGGWTLVIKANGNVTTFGYDESLWTNRDTHNPQNPDLDWTEAKLDAFNSVPVSEVLVSLTDLAGADRNVPPTLSPTSILISADSMHSVFNGNYRQAFEGRNTWLGLLSGSQLQNNCNQEGFNVRPSSNSTHRRVRVGIVGNDQDSCFSPNSFSGIGAGGAADTHTGNHARANGGASGNTDIQAFGVIMVRSELRSCFDHLNHGETQDGVYPVDPDGSSGPLGTMDVQCDMTTDGGGWTLVLNYLHAGGTNPDLEALGDALPLLGINATTLGDDGSSEKSSWGHATPQLLTTFNVGESRWFGETSAHGRTIHFKDVGFDFNRYIMSGKGCPDFILYVRLAGHNALLPDSLDFGSCNQDELAMTEDPFYHDNAEYWSIKGLNSETDVSNRWEVDDHPNDDSQDTHHQVWIR